MNHPQDFPVLGTAKAGQKPQTVPWAMLAPHEDTAYANHSQTLKRLAERSGLSWCEILAVLNDRPWRRVDTERAKTIVLGHVRRWAETHP